MAKSCIHAALLSLFSLLVAATPCAANLIWFDETLGGSGASSFADLASEYRAFMDDPAGVITFDDLAVGSALSTQYAAQHGVTFLNTAGGRRASLSTVHREGDRHTHKLTGYDGSYMPNHDNVFVKFDNDAEAAPFTITFDNSVERVGSFIGMGVQGNIHSVLISVFDAEDNLLGQRNVQSWLWEKKDHKQNYESFFGVSAEEPTISRVEILNNASRDFANALVVDNVAFASGASDSRSLIPEPQTFAFLVLGVCGLAFFHPRRLKV